MGLNLIQTGRFNRLFQKLFAIKGSANITEVGAEILPVIILRLGVEARYLEQWERFTVFFSTPAVAGQTGAARIRNPAGSNVIAVFEKINVSVGAADTFCRLELGPTAADLGTLGQGNRLDPRGRAATGLIISSSGTGVTLANTIEGAGVATGISYDYIGTEDQEIPLLPGDAIQVRTTTLNISMSGTFVWRERAMEESELK
jgi:hypothetical protein